MNVRLAVAASIVACFLTACTTQQDTAESDGTWVGSITTEGDVTTVVNESGSVWGGTATLVEEASIGVDAGAEAYMFAYINSVSTSDDRIAVLDENINIVRMYDFAGRFLFDVGGAGQGPGEYTDAIILAMDPEGRTYVFDLGNRRLSEYAPDGAYRASWDFPDFGCCAWQMYPQPNGLLWMPIAERDPETREQHYGAQLFSPEAGAPVGDPMWVPEIDFEPSTYDVGGRQIPAPLSARVVWQPTPGGGLLAGATDRYSFEIINPDGARIAVERFVEPVPIGPDERDWNRRWSVANWRQRDAGFNWDGAEIPLHRPAFQSLRAAVSGEIWVSRQVGSERLSECTEDPLEEFAGEMSLRPCYRPVFAVDVFAADGRYLGDVELPEPRPFVMHVDGDVIIGSVEDAAGVIMVKRYRLVPPGGE